MASCIQIISALTHRFCSRLSGALPSAKMFRMGARAEALAATCTRALAVPAGAIALACMLAIGAQAGAFAAEACAFSMEVLVGGVPVPEFSHGGRLYVEALRGREYSVRLTNRTGERVAVALAVDGLNSIDARMSTSREAAKWILDPWQTVTLDGWQTGSSTARHFFFTTETKSYGAWLGKANNLGVISAAVFREKHPAPVPWSQYKGRGNWGRERGTREDDGRRWREPKHDGELRDSDGPASSDDAGGGAPPRSSVAPEPSAPNEAPGIDALRAPAEKRAEKQELSNELAATGIGREVGHSVQMVSFDEEETPAATLEVRYEFRDALARLGVVPFCGDTRDRLARREESRGFTDGPFAPDPYRRGQR